MVLRDLKLSELVENFPDVVGSAVGKLLTLVEAWELVEFWLIGLPSLLFKGYFRGGNLSLTSEMGATGATLFVSDSKGPRRLASGSGTLILTLLPVSQSSPSQGVGRPQLLF